MLAVYRGVAYDTDSNFKRNAEYRKVKSTYRGIETTTTLKVEEVQK